MGARHSVAAGGRDGYGAVGAARPQVRVGAVHATEVRARPAPYDATGISARATRPRVRSRCSSGSASSPNTPGVSSVCVSPTVTPPGCAGRREQLQPVAGRHGIGLRKSVALGQRERRVPAERAAAGQRERGRGSPAIDLEHLQPHHVGARPSRPSGSPSSTARPHATSTRSPDAPRRGDRPRARRRRRRPPARRGTDSGRWQPPALAAPAAPRSARRRRRAGCATRRGARRRAPARGSARRQARPAGSRARPRREPHTPPRAARAPPDAAPRRGLRTARKPTPSARRATRSHAARPASASSSSRPAARPQIQTSPKLRTLAARGSASRSSCTTEWPRSTAASASAVPTTPPPTTTTRTPTSLLAVTTWSQILHHMC